MYQIRSPIFIFIIVTFCFIFSANSNANDNSLNDILNAINGLEKGSEPKCYATASRLEDFMYGTPFEDQARFAKNILQKEFIRNTWLQASLIAVAENEEVVLKSHIDSVVNKLFTTEKDKNDHWTLLFNNSKQNLTIHKDDKRQYASIAYSLRAVLAVQQDALMDVEHVFLPLSDNALNQLKNKLDLYTLAVLKVADNKAKKLNEKLITVSNINHIWHTLSKPVFLVNQAESENVQSKINEYKIVEPVLLKQIAEKKLTAYAAYNKVSNQLFIRNLQVYFARVSWPENEKESKEIISLFSSLLIEFSAGLYDGAQKLAMEKELSVISEQSVYDFAKVFIPHKVNEYEDVLFFPNFDKNKQIYLESYDMDAFRDAGVHWQYLTQAVFSKEFKVYLEPDPFSAELLVENIAQYGVLLLRVAGNIAKLNHDERLKPDHLIKATAQLTNKVALHATLKSKQKSHTNIASANSSTQEVKQGFSNVTSESGLLFEHKSSDWLNRQLRTFIKKDSSTGIITIPPAFGGSGVAAEDVNNDGFIDILLLGGRGNKLYINDGNGTYKDRTTEYNLDWLREQDSHPGEVRQPLIADINNDGWQDIIITYVNDEHRVYKNIEGKKFEDVTHIAKLGGKGNVGGPATLFDYDNDGDLDLYITYFGNYIKGDLPTLKRRNSNGQPNQFFENLGAFKFENRSVDSGLDHTGWAQAVAHTDINNDGWQDVIVGNDFGVNAYFINNRNGKFEEVSEKLGTDKPSYTMGIGISDLNADLIPDIYISNIVTMNKDESYILPNEDTKLKFNAEKLSSMKVIEANDLFISNHNGEDLHYLLSENIGRGYSSTGWSWDADFFDYDLDGDDDLYVLNGMNEFNLYSSKNPYYRDPLTNEVKQSLMPVSAQERNIFFENNKGKLNNQSEESGLALLGNSRSASYFDRDNDGDLDIIINNYHEPAVLFNNNADTVMHHWLKVKLIGNPEKSVSLDAIGAKIIVTLPDGKTIWREIRSTDGYMSVHPKEQHFGVGKAKQVDLKIIWPNGDTKDFKQIKVDQKLKIAL